MLLHSRIEGHFRASAELKLASIATLTEPIARATTLMWQALERGNKLLACGNGGSAGDAAHFATELVGRLERERRELAAIALTTDSAMLTAIANDYDYRDVFAKQVRGLGRAGDVLLAISTSGKSPNVIAAVDAAHEKGVRVVALTGKGGGKLSAMLKSDDVNICVPHDRTMRVQEVHLLTLHCLCDGIDAYLFGDKE